MPKQSKAIAVLISDIHLSDKAPAARAGEPNWFKAMQRPLDQIKEITKHYRVPIICAGDIFDKYNPSPELINFAIEHLPTMYAIPGQHDLPYHVYADMKKSAYYTLMTAGTIRNCFGPTYIGETDFVAVFFPWGEKIKPLKEFRADEECKIDAKVYLAVAHSYCWIKDHKYPHASSKKSAGKYWKNLSGYDAAVFGDNHKGFHTTHSKNGNHLFNCGTLMRRKTDEKNYKPQVGLLFDDGTIKPIYLSTKEDIILGVDNDFEVVEELINMSSLISELNDLGTDAVNFREIVSNFLANSKVKKKIRKLVMEAIDKE